MKKIFTLIAGILMTVGAQAQTWTLDINKIYDDCVNKTGACANATASGTKYTLNDATIEQDIFTVVSKSNRTSRVDLIQTDADKNLIPVEYAADYTGKYRIEPNGASNSTGGRQIFLDAPGSGTLKIGAWSGTDGRKLFVMKATDKTSYYNVANASSTDYKHEFTADENSAAPEGNPRIFEIEIPTKGIYCITQDAGIYFGYISFTQTGSGEEIPNAPTPATVWNFATDLSSTDAANLSADATSWNLVEDKYYSNTTVITERNVYAPLKANGAELELTKGIQFTRDNSSGLDADRIRIAPGKYLAINGSACVMKFEGLSMNDNIKLRVKGGGDTERKLNITNGSIESIDNKVEPNGEGQDEAVEFETEFTVAHNGDLFITPSNGFQFMAIAINTTLPEKITDGIQTVKATTTTTAGAMYNLAGQKVAEGYKGVVIQNGKKIVK